MTAQEIIKTTHPAEPEMILVQGGTFMMGATPEQGTDIHKKEKPVHQVTVSDFYIGKYTVTQAQWKAVMGDNPSLFQSCHLPDSLPVQGDNLPVERVSWDDVEKFICKLHILTGKPYRLPTEAEWEFAARGGNNSKGYKYSGSNTLDDVAWYGANSDSITHPVGTKSPNELGIFDMSGNVWEWCNDWYGDYNSNPKTNPRGPSRGSLRVLRGCSQFTHAKKLNVSSRGCVEPYINEYTIGFRLACDSVKNEVTGEHSERQCEQETGIPMIIQF